MHEAFKSSGLLTETGEICDKDAYYIGVVLDNGGKANATVTISDKNGKVLDYLTLTPILQGDSIPHYVPVPVFASGGIDMALTGDLTVACIVYYAEQVGGHKHV